MCLRFSFLSVVFLIGALAFLLPAESLSTRLLLFPGIFLMTAALQSFFTGLILSTVARKNRQDFEFQLFRVQSEYESKMKFVD